MEDLGSSSQHGGSGRLLTTTKLLSLPDNTWASIRNLAASRGLSEAQTVEVAIAHLLTGQHQPPEVLSLPAAAASRGQAAAPRLCQDEGWGALVEHLAEPIFQHLLATGGLPLVGRVRQLSRHWRDLAGAHTKELTVRLDSWMGQLGIGQVPIKAHLVQSIQAHVVQAACEQLCDSFPAVQALELHVQQEQSLADAAVASLARLRCLTRLCLKRPNSSARGSDNRLPKAPASLLDLAGLTKIELHDQALSTAMMQQLLLSKCVPLTELRIHSCNIDAEAVAVLAGATALRRLYLNSVRFALNNDAADPDSRVELEHANMDEYRQACDRLIADIAAALGSLTAITHLDIARVTVNKNESAMMDPENFLQLKGMEKLEYVGGFRYVLAEDIVPLVSCRTVLTEINLGAVHVNDELLTALASCPMLKTACMAAYGPTVDRDGPALRSFAGLSCLASLTLEGAAELDEDTFWYQGDVLQSELRARGVGLQRAELKGASEETVVRAFIEMLQAAPSRLVELEFNVCCFWDDFPQMLQPFTALQSLVVIGSMGEEYGDSPVDYTGDPEDYAYMSWAEKLLSDFRLLELPSAKYHFFESWSDFISQCPVW